MKRQYRHSREYLVLVVLVALAIALLVFFLTRGQEDINFCRRTIFGGLVSGRQSVKEFIDWEHFKGLGLDFAEAYARLPNTQERQAYQQAFVASFSLAFKRLKGRSAAFTNWRIYRKADQEVVVAADYPAQKKTLLFTFSKGGGIRKLVALEWKDRQ